MMLDIAISLNDKVKEFYNNLGVAYERLKQYEDALKAYLKAITLDSSYKKANDFKFNQLRVGIDRRGIDNFNQRKQDIYLNNDIFLQLSNSEGNSYASLDALICGLVVVSSDVGLFYKDVPEDCFVKLDWRKNGDVEYVESKLRYAWEHREELARKGREWYMNNCRFVDWKKKMYEVVKT